MKFVTKKCKSNFSGTNSPNQEHNIASLTEQNINEHLAIGLQEDELFLHFQPKVNKDGALLGLEALLRWDSKSLGSLPPGVFIPVAEKFGLIAQITPFVVLSACRQFQKWKTQYNIVTPIAINISCLDLEREGFVKHLTDTCAEFDVPTNYIVLELTESTVSQDDRQAEDNITLLKTLGFKISLDDFGTGYSGLSKLAQFEVDEVKIDRRFVNNIDTNLKKQTICSGILATCSQLDVSVLVEGIENRKQLDTLIKLGFKSFQGYGFACPLSSQTLDMFYQDNKKYFITSELLRSIDTLQQVGLEQVHLS